MFDFVPVDLSKVVRIISSGATMHVRSNFDFATYAAMLIFCPSRPESSFCERPV